MGRIILIVVLAATSISLLWFFAWYRLVDKLVEVKTPRKRAALFILVSTFFQVLVNVLANFTRLFPLASWFMLDVLSPAVTMIVVFTLQGVLMWRMLYPRARPARAVSAIALAYFFVNTTMITISYVAQRVYGYLLSGWTLSETGEIIYAYFNQLPIHLVALGVSFGVGALIERTRFASYYGKLFTAKRRGWICCGVSLMLMHLLDILYFAVPMLAQSVAFNLFGAVFDLLVLFAILFVAVFMADREKVKLQESFIAQQQMYVQTLEGLQADMRAFRHDYQNLLSGMYLQASEGNLEALQETLQSTLHYVDDRLGNRIKQVTELARVEISEIKSLLLVKLVQAEQMGGAVELEIPAPVSRVDINYGDFIRCLGILIDNALEAAEGEGPPVRIALIQQDEALDVIVANPCKQPPQLHRMGEPGYTTKGPGHGTGLGNYRAITDHYSNVACITSFAGGIFRQQLQIRRTV